MERRGLENDMDENKNNPLPYPCPIANRFECPYMRKEKYQMQNLMLKIYLSWPTHGFCSRNLLSELEKYSALSNKK